MKNKAKHNKLFADIVATLENVYLPKYIILYGSFSRYEGTWNNDLPMNDIDLIFIDGEITGEIVNKSKVQLKEKLGVRFIDIAT